MAVVKTNYIQAKRAGSKAAIKETVDYIAHRENKEGEKVTRRLFGHDGEMGKEQAHQMIDEAGDDIYFYRIMISPDPKNEDEEKNLDLWTLTQRTIVKLEERLGTQLQFVATEHNDQTDIRHIHSIVLIPGRLNRPELHVLRQAATDAALTRQPEPARGPERQTEQILQARARGGDIPSSRSERQLHPRYTPVSCPVCGGSQRMQRLPGNLYRCPGCQLVIAMGQGRERGDWQLQR